MRWRLATHQRIDEQSRPLLGQCARRAELLADEICEALAPKPAPSSAVALEAEFAAPIEAETAIERLEAKLPAPRKWGWVPLIGWFRSKAA